MNQYNYILVIQFLEKQNLINIFGSEAIEKGFQELIDDVEKMKQQLLSQHQVIEHSSWDNNCRTYIKFKIISDNLIRDVEETCFSIEEAGRNLLHSYLIDVFGTGTVQHVKVKLLVTRLTDSLIESSTDKLQLWLDKQLDKLELPLFWNPNISRDDIQQVIEHANLQTVIQPIVNMKTREIVGYEALSRGPEGTELERPDILFSAARSYGLITELELICAQLALERTNNKLSSKYFLTINLGPESIKLAHSRLPLEHSNPVIFELTEHLPLEQSSALIDSVSSLNQQNIDVALDDTGCGFADLKTAEVLKPSIVKLCITIIRNADNGDYFLNAICQSTNELTKLDCKVLAEGVETEEQHQALLSCNIEYAQGWLYGKPVAI